VNYCFFNVFPDVQASLFEDFEFWKELWSLCVFLFKTQGER
jgi:hypothetical protein